MKCPYCGAEMELGYIQCRDGVIWDTKIRKVAAWAAWPFVGKGSIHLGADGAGPFSGTSVAAYNCNGCKKIIIDYSQES